MNDNTPDSPSRSRRDFLLLLATGTVGAAMTAQAQPRPSAAAALPAGVPSAMTVYKDPNCGCCAEWVKHIRKAGFVVSVRDTADMATVKSAMGVPGTLQSCHTARVGSYVLEGHVPADLIVKLLQQKPLALGLAVPGMPVGSPGMDGSPPDKYDVLLFDKTGKSRVYASRG
jgi:hypothetical protein